MIFAYLLPVIIFLSLPSFFVDPNSNNYFYYYIITAFITIKISTIIGYFLEPKDKIKTTKWLILILNALTYFTIYGVFEQKIYRSVGLIFLFFGIIGFIFLSKSFDKLNKKGK